MKKSNLNARSLKVILVFTIIVTISLSVAGFYLAQDWLGNISTDISNTVANSNSSGNDLQALKRLEDNLAKKQDVIIKSSALISSPDSYQGQTIKDLNKYASDVGITISDYSFSQSTTGTKTTTKSKTTDNQSTVTLSVVSPISYTALLKFLSLVESNLPKMQVSSVDLGRINSSSDSVRIDKLIIEVYTS